MEYEVNLEPNEEGKENAFIIDRTNYIEYQLKTIIAGYIQPEGTKVEFVENILLNNSIINFAAKVKLFRHISKIKEWKEISPTYFDTIMSIRNAFAHNNTVGGTIKVMLNKDNSVSKVESYMTLDTISGSGKFTQIKRKEALQKFTNSYVLVKKYLDEIIEVLKVKKQSNL